MKVFLIGYMGVGKSTIGKRLASALGIPFVDLDKEIEKTEGNSIAEIFAEKGEAYFRKKETKALTEMVQSALNAVISTGGGTPCHAENMDVMLNSGVVVWLQLPSHVIAQRLVKSQSERPLIAGLLPDVLPDFIRDHLESRLPFYQRAHIAFDTRDINAEKLKALTAMVLAHGESKT
jgi:shikimate kinase